MFAHSQRLGPWHGRGWVHFNKHQQVGAEWHVGRRQCTAGIQFSDTGDHALMVWLALPFLFTVYLWIDRLPVQWLPGVRWTGGDYNTGERELSLGFHHGALFYRLWTHPDNCDQRFGAIHFDDLLLGKVRRRVLRQSANVATVELPEGFYRMAVRLFEIEYRRPRWPFPQRVTRFDAQIADGIPIPGKWGDDAVYSLSAMGGTVAEAVEAVRLAVLRDRGGEAWAPADGWPSHCLKR